MGVYIKGMKLPSDCSVCPLETDYGTCGYYSFYVEAGHDSDYRKRRDDCPLIEVPSADVAEVVRCKDCKNNYVTTHNHGKQDDPRCDFTDRHLSLNDFCSRGERRMDGGT